MEIEPYLTRFMFYSLTTIKHQFLGIIGIRYDISIVLYIPIFLFFLTYFWVEGNEICRNRFCICQSLPLVFIQALAFVHPVRNFFLQEENYKDLKRPPGDIMIQLGLIFISLPFIIQYFAYIFQPSWIPYLWHGIYDNKVLSPDRNMLSFRSC